MAIKLTDKQRKIIADSVTHTSDEKVLEVSNLVISFKTDNGKVQAVRGVSFDLYKGETLCIVGESGSGKSVTSKAIMGILSANAIVEGGQIIYHGEDLLRVSEEEYHRIRGHEIGMIFQDPLSSLNPIVKIGKQIIETMMINSNQLKNYYNDLIAPELTAYTNAKVVRDSEIRDAQIKETETLKVFDKEVNKRQGEISELKQSIREIKKANGDSTNEQARIDALKAEIASIKNDKKAKAVELKQATKDKELEAKNRYKKVAPELKAKLKVRKQEAKVLTKQHAIDLADEYNKKAAELDAKVANITISPESQAKFNDLKKRVTKEQVLYGVLFTLCYFFNKKKQILRAKHLEKMAAFAKEREAILEVNEIDKLLAEKKKAYNEYRFQIRITKSMAKRRAVEVMKEVGIPDPEKRFYQYPFQFSGGMRQRIVIAIALIAEPHILICDEPTTALDVTIQAQILELINKLKAKHEMTVIFITHDLGVVANMADRVAVMYAGKIVEYGADKEIFFDPRHPYTWALLSSIPDIDSKEKLEAIPGTPPDMIYPPVGDAFALRNKNALGIDFKYEPPFFEISPTHKAATWLEHENAPDVEPPKIVIERIYKALEEEEALLKNEK